MQVTSETQELLSRIDAIIRELESLRRQLTKPASQPGTGLSTRLFGALGKGEWGELDPSLDWRRFAE